MGPFSMRSARAGLSAVLVMAVVVGLPPVQSVAAPSPVPPSPSTPRQAGGTAAGRSHAVAATATAPRAGVTAAPATKTKRPKGAVPEYKLHEPARKETSSGTRVQSKPKAVAQPKPKLSGFNKRTSVRRSDLSSATTTVFQNVDGTFTAEVHSVPVNRKAADGTWQADPAARTATTTSSLAAAAVTNPTGQRTTSDSTYVKSGVTQNFSSDNALYVGSQGGYNYNSFLKFDGFGSQFANAYVINAKLYLDTEFSGGNGVCASTPTSVAPITAAWDPATLKTFPGPATGAVIGSASWAGGVNCSEGRVWAAVPLSARTFTNWAHGWAPNYGLALTAPYNDSAWKEFNPDDAYLSIEYAADGAGASYAETLYLSPWNNKTGWAKVTVQNEGSATWTPTNGYQLGYQIYTVTNGVRTLYSTSNYLTPMPANVPPNKSATVTATLPALTPGSTYQVCWDMVHNGQYFSGLGIPQACYALDVVNNAPVLDSLYPYNNSTQYSLTPTLQAIARDVDAYPGTALSYTFNLYTAGSTTVLATSGATSSPSWTVPSGKVSWGGSYYWQAQVSDGNKASAWSQPGYFSVPAPAQPLLTSHLGAAPADATINGVNPASGNYTTTAVDASPAAHMAGPRAEIRRTYNSLDPSVTNAFGAGWSSLLDTRVVPDADGSGSVLIVLPDGRQERFGRNPDGSFTAPPGSAQVLTTNASPYSSYQLRDPSGLRYEFAQATVDPVTGQSYSGLEWVFDPQDHNVQIGWTQVTLTGADGVSRTFDRPSYLLQQLTRFQGFLPYEHGIWFEWGAATVTTAPGRTVTVPHVTKAYLPQPGLARQRDWTYGYDSANNLTTVCPPTSATACTTYSYNSGNNSGSHYSSMVLDSSPRAYWRLTDTAGSTRAADQVAVNVGTYDATLTNVTLGQPGALAGSPATSASFNGISSKMALPDHLLDGNTLAVGLWFKTSQAGGALLSYQSVPAGTVAASGYTPALYIGTDGKLRGQFWNGGATPMVSTAAVNDNKWHHVVLSGAGSSQALFLDGTQIGTLTGGNIAPLSGGQPYVTVGAGHLYGGWPAVPANNTLGWFAGQIQDVFFLNKPIGLPAVQQEYAAGTLAARELVTSKLPSGKTVASLGYDLIADRVTSVTTGDGGSYAFGLPTTTGSTGYYRGAVLSTRPTFAYPLNEDSGTVARNLLGLNASAGEPRDGTYSNVILGTPGIFGDNGDTAASFDGKSAYLSLPAGAFDDATGNASVAMWFRTTTAGGTLFSYQRDPVGTPNVTAFYTPALYIGTDGKLRGQFWDNNLSPMLSTSAVNDGTWHMVVMTASGTAQSLWIDGVRQATRNGAAITGFASSWNMRTVTIGAGYITGGWPAYQLNNPQGYFNGQIAQAAVYALNIDDIAPGVAAALFQAKGSAMTPTPTTTITVTEPGGTNSTITLDPGNGMRTTAITNSLGQTTRYSYDAAGNQAGITDANGHTLSRVFDPYSKPVQQTTCQTASSCQTSSYTYYRNSTDPADPRNFRMQFAVDGRAGSSGVFNTAYRTTYTYTAVGDISTVTTPPTTESPNGRTTSYGYTTATTPTYPASGNYAPAGLLSSVTDPRGQITTYDYDLYGRPTRLTEPSGQRTEYQYDGYRDHLAATTVYSDANPSGVPTEYRYDDQDRMVAVLAPTTTNAVTGRVHTAYTSVAYDVDGNTASQTAADWGQITVQYVPNPDDPSSGSMQVKVPVAGQTGLDTARTTTYSYNAASRIASVTDPLNNTTSYSYNAFGWATSSTAADGQVYRYDYSSVGDLLTTTLQGFTGDPAAPSAPHDLVLESRAYDPGGRLASVTDAIGRTTAYTYFDDNQVQSVTSAAGTPDAVVTASYTYDAGGHKITECTGWTAGTGCATQVLYTIDAANRVTKTVTDPSGANIAVTSTFDANDNVLSTTTTGGGDTRATSFGYDSAGRLTSQSVTAGSDTLTTTMAYDQRGLLTSSTDPRGNRSGATAAAYTSTYRYDEAGRPVAVTSPPASIENVGGTAATTTVTTLTGYNTFGEITEQKSPTGKIQTNTYDTGGQLLSTAWPAYTPPGGTAVNPVVRYAYDKLGQLTTLTDPLGNDQSYTYDQLGNQVTVTLQDGRTSRTSYDTVGEALSVTDPTGARTEATYNALGQVITSTQIVRGTTPAAYTTTYGYSPAGLLTNSADPLGHVSTSSYDHLGRLTGDTDPLGNTTSYTYNLDGQVTKQTAPDGTATTVTYDQVGRATTVTDRDAGGAAVRSSSFGYDPAGNQTAATDPLNKTITASYDALNRTTGQTQPGSAGQTITTSFGYDADGHTTRYTDPNGNPTTYTYNTLGLQESTVVPSVAGQTSAADRTTWLRYDAAGRPTSTTRPGNVTVTATYDKAGRLLTQAGSGADAATSTRSFEYDAADRLITATSPTSVERYTYDDRGLMLTAAMPGWNTTFTNDAAGRAATRTDPTGTTIYGYDTADRQTSQTDPLTGTTIAVAYNNVGQASSVTYGAGGATRAYTYDALHQLTSDVLKNPAGATQASVAYGYDTAGHLTSKTTAGVAGAASNTYTYDDAGRLASWTAGSATTPYSYDPAGNRTRAGPNTYSYNARSQLTGATNGTSTTSYSYTRRGTTAAITSGGSTTNITSDAYDQQITNGASSYTYDALGRLTNLTSPAGNRTFAYDSLSNNVVSDGTQTFARTADGSLLSATINGVGNFLNVDRHGDVTGTFTPAGNTLTSSTTYDPYGAVVTGTGPRSDIGYQSGWTDPATSFVNAASRWYNPATGTFTSADTQQNEPSPAVNANPYAYGNDNPLGNNDPSGHDSCSAQMQWLANYKAMLARLAESQRTFWDRVNARMVAENHEWKLENEAHLKQAIEESKALARINAIGHEVGPPIPANSYKMHNATTSELPGSSGGHGSGGSNGGQSSSSGTAYSLTSARLNKFDQYDLYRTNLPPTQSAYQYSQSIPSSVNYGQKTTHWYNKTSGRLAIGVVALGAVMLPPAVVVGVAAGYALAAADSTTCTAANAPAKPTEQTQQHTAGPASPSGSAATAGQADDDLPGSVGQPTEEPAVAGSGPTQTWWQEDDCLVTGWKRPDGTHKATVWDCGSGGASSYPKVYRAPKMGNKAAEERGLDPANHPDNGRHPGTAYLGATEEVVQQYADQGIYEDGYWEYTMSPDFEKHFPASGFRTTHDNKPGEFQWVIPRESIPKFNSLIADSRWINYYKGHTW